MRTTITAGAIAGLLVTPVALAAPAQAETTCNIKVLTPKVYVDDNYEYAQVSFGQGCAGTDAARGLYDASGRRRGTFFYKASQSGSYQRSVRIADHLPSGTWRIKPLGARNVRTGAAVRQNSGSLMKKMNVKVGGSYTKRYARYSLYRTITVSPKVTKYSSSANRYRNHVGASVKLYRRPTSGGSWRYLATRTTNRYGKVYFKTGYGKSMEYRIYVVGTKSVWGTKTYSFFA